MSDIKIIENIMIAENSSGNQSIDMILQNNEINFTLTGVYNGEEIQIDFNSIGKSEAKRLAGRIVSFVNLME